MAVLLLRCAGPMQSWGTHSRFRERDTGLEPSKSGVAGVLCAALGRGRGEAVDDLAGLRMGVRVDREGRVMSDFHTAMNVARAGGGVKETEISNRHYLSDAAFLVGLEGEDVRLLSACHAALKSPVWPLFLGRKGFPPGEPVWLPQGLQESLCLEEALSPSPGAVAPWCPRPGEAHPRFLRAVLEDPDGDEVRPDQPIGASFETRRFSLRRVRTMFWSFDDAATLAEMGP